MKGCAFGLRPFSVFWEISLPGGFSFWKTFRVKEKR